MTSNLSGYVIEINEDTLSSVKFSQPYVTACYEWDKARYEPMTIVDFLDGQLVSIDNRRLRSLKMLPAPPDSLVIYQVLCFTVSSDANGKRIEFSIAFKHEDNCIVITLRPKCYGSCVYARCAVQSADCSLIGSHDLPVVDKGDFYTRSTHWWPTDDDVEISQLPKSDFEGIYELLQKADEIVCYLADGCPINANKQFVDMVCSLNFVEFCKMFRISRIQRRLNYGFVKAACAAPDGSSEVDKFQHERMVTVLLFREFAFRAEVKV